MTAQKPPHMWALSATLGSATKMVESPPRVRILSVMVRSLTSMVHSHDDPPGTHASGAGRMSLATLVSVVVDPPKSSNSSSRCLGLSSPGLSTALGSDSGSVAAPVPS